MVSLGFAYKTYSGSCYSIPCDLLHIAVPSGVYSIVASLDEWSYLVLNI